MSSPLTGGVPATIFASKVPNHGDVLNGPLDISLNNEAVVMERLRDWREVRGVGRQKPELAAARLDSVAR